MLRSDRESSKKNLRNTLGMVMSTIWSLVGTLKDFHLTFGDLFLDEMNIEFYALGPFMLDTITIHEYCTDVVTEYQMCIIT